MNNKKWIASKHYVSVSEFRKITALSLGYIKADSPNVIFVCFNFQIILCLKHLKRDKAFDVNTKAPERQIL